MENSHFLYLESLQKTLSELTLRVRRQLLRDIYYRVPLQGSSMEELNANYAFEFIPHAYQIILLRVIPKVTADPARSEGLPEEIALHMKEALLPFFHELETTVVDRRVMCLCNITTDRDSTGTERFKIGIGRFFTDLSTAEQYRDYEFVMAEGTPAESVEEIGSCFHTAVQAMEYGVVYGLNRRYDSYELTRELDDILSILTSARRSRLKHGMETMNRSMLKEILDEVFEDSLPSVQNNPGLAYRLPHSLLDICAEEIRENTRPSDELNALLEKHHGRIDDCIYLRELRTLTDNAIRELLDYRSRCAGSAESAAVRIVKQYIEENYAKKLYISEIADAVSLNPQYLSALFRRETGITVTDHLTAVRIGHAKRLLRESNAQVQEIAESVGYEDPHYFSRVFRQQVGSSPQTYRGSRKQRQE